MHCEIDFTVYYCAQVIMILFDRQFSLYIYILLFIDITPFGIFCLCVTHVLLYMQNIIHKLLNQIAQHSYIHEPCRHVFFFFHLLYIPMTYPGDIRMCLVFQPIYPHVFPGQIRGIYHSIHDNSVVRIKSLYIYIYIICKSRIAHICHLKISLW